MPMFNTKIGERLRDRRRGQSVGRTESGNLYTTSGSTPVKKLLIYIGCLQPFNATAGVESGRQTDQTSTVEMGQWNHQRSSAESARRYDPSRRPKNPCGCWKHCVDAVEWEKSARKADQTCYNNQIETMDQGQGPKAFERVIYDGRFDCPGP